MIDMPKVLMADDEEAMRTLVRITLGTGQFELIEATDGAMALALARRHHPDLFLLDWAMPVMSGLEVCQKLRADATTRDIRIVMLTARAQAFDRSAAIEAGVDDYITKPFSPLQLLEKVREALGPGVLA
jgi:two-component system phosphate regulon response regulator PhoB